MKRATRPSGVKVVNFKRGPRIQKVRTAKKLTQEQIAEKIGAGEAGKSVSLLGRLAILHTCC